MTWELNRLPTGVLNLGSYITCACSYCAGVKETFYRVEVVGDFCADEARKFFEMLKGRACEDDDWRQVYEVSNGVPERLLSSMLGMMDLMHTYVYVSGVLATCAM